MSELTLHTGASGSTILNGDWFDHNNITHKSRLEVRVPERDKPRTVEIVLDGIVLATL